MRVAAAIAYKCCKAGTYGGFLKHGYPKMMVFHGFSDLKSIYKWRFLHMGMDQYLLIPFLVG